MSTNRKAPTPEEVLAHLRFNSPYLSDINDRLAGGIEAIQKTATNLLEGELLTHLLQLNLTCLELTVQDYTLLAGTFNHFRTRTDSYDIREELRNLINQAQTTSCKSYLIKLLSIIEGAWKIADKRLIEHQQATTGFMGKLSGVFKKNTPELGFSQEFASDALLILRTTFPAGVNMLSPNWDGEFDSLDAENTIRLRMTVPDPTNSATEFHDSIEIGPYGRGVSLLSYSSAHAISHSFPQMIRNGESILIGRDLGIKELFGVSRKNRPILLVEVKGKVDDPNVSRAGLMIFRHKNRIYIFNRGSMNNYVIEERSGEQELTTTDFSANTVLKDGGFFAFGEASQTILGSAAAHRENLQQTTFQPLKAVDPAEVTMCPGSNIFDSADSTFISSCSAMLGEPDTSLDLSNIVELQDSLVPDSTTKSENSVPVTNQDQEPDAIITRKSKSSPTALSEHGQLTLPPMAKEHSTGTTNTGSIKLADIEQSQVVRAGDESDFGFVPSTYETFGEAQTSTSPDPNAGTHQEISRNASTAFNKFSSLFAPAGTDGNQTESKATEGVVQPRASAEYEIVSAVSQTAGTVLSSRSDIPGIGKLEIDVTEEADIIIDDND